jgi:hypothetical protein
VFTENTAAFIGDFGVPASLISAPGTWNFADQLMTWSNASFLMDGTATPVTYNALVIFDEPDSAVLGDRAISTDYTIIYRTGDFPPLVKDMEITVGGNLFTVIDSMKVADGVFSRATLEL